MKINADQAIMSNHEPKVANKPLNKSNHTTHNENFKNDTVELSRTSKALANTLSLDKGTASHTTL